MSCDHPKLKRTQFKGQGFNKTLTTTTCAQSCDAAGPVQTHTLDALGFKC